MRFLNLLRPSRRDKSPTPPSNAEMEVRFQKWFQNTTIADVRSLFFENLLEGNDATPPLLNPGELEHFDGIVSSLATNTSQHIEISSVIDYLKQAHKERAQIIESARPILENMVTSQAHYPFSEPVSLTRDKLLQSIILLTWRCKKYFNQRIVEGDHDVVRQLPEKERLEFIFSSLAYPPTGGPTLNDVIVILSRINYPMGQCRKPKGEPIRKPVIDLEPLAERLQPEENTTIPKCIPVSTLQPLFDLAAALSHRWQDPVANVGFGKLNTLNADRFVRWAQWVLLFDVLDQVFEVFLRNPLKP